jgi:hypothetical protein
MKVSTLLISVLMISMIAPSASAHEDTASFLLDLGALTSRDRIAFGWIKESPKDAINLGRAYCKFRDQYTKDGWIKRRESEFKLWNASRSFKLYLRAIDTSAATNLCSLTSARAR